jgi:hypothetical protein
MLLALLIAAQSAAGQAPDLSLFKPFLGACWRAEFSATVHDTHCFEGLYGGSHVRDRHEVQDNGKTIYAGETTYSADGPDVVFIYVNSLGGIGRGKVKSQAQTLRFTGEMRASPDKAQQPIDSEWRVLDADHYEVRSLVNSPSTGSPEARTFTRVKP